MKQQAYEYILQKMTRGELEPGMQISELSIASELGISRSPVRDALSQMVAEGMVERVPRFGTVIRKFSAQEISDLYDMRVALESYAAAQAASRISPDALQQLEVACEGIEHIAQQLKKTGQGELDADMLAEMSRLDMKFHLIILRATGNRMLLKSAHESRLMSRIFGIPRVPSFDWDYVHGVYRYHRDIFEAIERGDAEASRAAMARHINFGKEGGLKFIAEHQQHQDREAFETIADQIFDGVRAHANA